MNGCTSLVGFGLIFLLSLLCGCDDSASTLDLGGDSSSSGDIDATESDTEDDSPVAADDDLEENEAIVPADLDEIESQPEEEFDPDPEPEVFDEEEVEPEADPEPEIEEVICETSEPFDYSCHPSVPETCPGGMCVLGTCIGPVLDADRWDDCDNGTCDPCEFSCRADCGPDFVMTGEKDYELEDTTLTVWVHGFTNKSNSDLEQMVYGADRSCSGIFEAFSRYGHERPCGESNPTAPNQFAKLEYYGGIPADWLTDEQVAEIEQYPYTDGYSRLHRYGLILAYYLRHKLDVTGATHFNMACHSMGCMITRYVIENNMENLAAENRFVRWFTSAGVLAGARLARLYDNETVRDTASAIGLDQGDFTIMNPDFYMDNVTTWNHKLYDLDNPLFEGMIIHNGCATDPHIAEAGTIRLLDLNNPGNEPNDGIMFTLDEFFHTRGPLATMQPSYSEPLPPTHTFTYVDHMTYPDTGAAEVLATAVLFHKRKVFIEVKEVTLYNDLEKHELFDGNDGQPPAEVAVESQVRYNPYILDTYGQNILVHDDRVDNRSTEIFIVEMENAPMDPDYTVFAGPIFDQMTELYLKVSFLEMDSYARFGISEMGISLDPHDELIGFEGQIQLYDHDILWENDKAKVVLEVNVVDMY